MADEAAALDRQGEGLLGKGQILEALAAFDRALALQPDHAMAAQNRGRALAELGRLHEAIDWCARALSLQPGLAAAHACRARCHRDLGEGERAVEDYEIAIGLDGTRADWQIQYATLLADLGLVERARIAYREAASNGADAKEIAFLLSAAGGAPPPPAPPASYVAALFDAYAPRFERHLTRRLKYRAPQLLADAVLPLLDRPPVVADLGCGTGLMGALLRSQAARLDGVDVAAKMLERAQARNIYDALHLGDLVEFLRARPASYDLVVAADVFVYVGDLHLAFDAARRALRGEGLLAFTVEALDEGDMTLQPTRRYAHSRRYIERVAGAHGFAARGITRRALRLNGDAEVTGYVAVFAARGKRG